MSTLYVFRGISATGKTTLTNLLSKKLKICVLRKDDFYDILAGYERNNHKRNLSIYSMIQKIIITNIQNGNDIIVDISLPHYEYIQNFLSFFCSENIKIKNFLCICSDEKIWEKRIFNRIGSNIPNQGFKSIEEAKSYYSNNDWDYKLLENEVTLDSVMTAEELLKKNNLIITTYSLDFYEVYMK